MPCGVWTRKRCRRVSFRCLAGEAARQEVLDSALIPTRSALDLTTNHAVTIQSSTRWPLCRQILLYPQDNLSPVLCHAPVTGHVTVTRAVPRQWWSTWLEGHSRGMAPVVATSKSQSRPPGQRPLWPTQTHLLHPMAPKWSKLTEGALS